MQLCSLLLALGYSFSSRSKLLHFVKLGYIIVRTIIIIIIITLMPGIYCYISESNPVSEVYSVSVIQYLQFMLHAILFHKLNDSVHNNNKLILLIVMCWVSTHTCLFVPVLLFLDPECAEFVYMCTLNWTEQYYQYIRERLFLLTFVF